MTYVPTAEDAAASTRTAGITVPPETAARMARAITPALTTFAPIAQALPFDLEPATFLAVQKPKEAGK
ncbi:hypothetical protein GCM10007301_36750 [Azorhizobium oxalatiphilum]|uniref:Uncharacterized protein n=1 Tax=Azorhizobium oxalatiphilum TaxID=980631 RepID=A0A917C7B4_9HYPH|nr:hypothetical protein [Azorhizobium oxalatiphilum]GGF73572.1 hypothetical protein GCM10007301_36750 [Azorhizobium oxalatiphilum]